MNERGRHCLLQPKRRLVGLLLALFLLPACQQSPRPAEGPLRVLRLATTSSTDNTGLLDTLLPPFTERYGVAVHVIAVGTGKAIRHAENGDVDVILVHDPEAEERLVAAGFGVNRRRVMHNDFVIVGPTADPAGVRGAPDAPAAFRGIAGRQATFISRGDASGTHQKELALWRLAGLEPAGDWYLAAGQGMGAVLMMAHDKAAYTLCDRGTFIAYKSKVSLHVLLESDARLFNPYSVIAVNPARHPHANYMDAMLFIGYLTSPAGQRIIAGFRVAGEPLFHPDALTGDEMVRGESIVLGGLSGALRLFMKGDPRVYSAAFVSLWVAGVSTLIAASLGLPAGVILALGRFRGRQCVIAVFNTLLALPTVVIGLFVYAFIRRGSLLGPLDLLYSPAAMIIGQVILALPIVVALGNSAIEALDAAAPETAVSLGASHCRVLLTTAWEARRGLAAVIAAAAGRVIAEVGVSIMLGGNIAGYTRTLTTAIALETAKGEFAFAFALGMVLVLLALLFNLLLRLLQHHGEARP